MAQANRSRALHLAVVATTFVTAVVTFAGFGPGSASGTTAAPTFVEMGGLSTAAGPSRIAAGPDGNIWFTEPGVDKVAKVTSAGAVTEFAVPSPNSLPSGIAAGPDGNLWFTEKAAGKVASVTPSGSVTEFALTAGAAPFRITLGPDGDLWFTDPGTHSIGRVTTTGVVTEFVLVDTSATPTDVAPGPDGNVWFTELHGHFVGRITPAGVISEYAAPNVTTAGGITSGSDGNLWFGEPSVGKIGKLTTSGALTELALPTQNAQIADVTRGPDGNVWFAESVPAQIGTITPLGTGTEFPVPYHYSPSSLVTGTDSHIWFTAPAANLIGEVIPAATATTTTTATSSTTTSSSTSTSSTTSTTLQGKVALSRLSGSDRIATAVAISGQSFPAKGSAKAVVLAEAFGSFADALAGSPLAAAKNGPLLLTGTTALDPRVKAEISRVLPAGGTVYVLGGPSAIDPSLDASLTSSGYAVTRLAGSDRFATAVAIADAGLGNPPAVFEANGLDFADALSGGPLAASNQGAILLTNGVTQAPATAAYLAAHASDRRAALGGPASAADPSATSIVGSDRWDTSAKIAATFPSPKVIGVASGVTAPDALAGGAAVAEQGGPLVLVPATTPLPAPVSTWCTSAKGSVTAGFVYGGTVAVPDAVMNAVKTALGG